MDGDEMRYSRKVNSIVARAAVGITEDLDVHFEWPYVLGDDREWRFGLHNGVPTGGVPPAYVSTIESNAVDADGQPKEVPTWTPTTAVEQALEKYALRLSEVRRSLDQEIEGQLQWLDQQRPTETERR